MAFVTYAEVPYDVIYDVEVLSGQLNDYDWLHLHHEELASELGFGNVWQLKHAVAATISEYVEGGGFLFAMCIATDTIDIVLAWLHSDIVPAPFDNTPYDPTYKSQVDYSKAFAFQDFKLVTNAMVYEFSDLDTSNYAMMRGAMAGFISNAR